MPKPMYWESEIEVTFKIKVELVQDDLRLDKCEEALISKAEEKAKKQFGSVVPFLSVKIVPNTVKGVSIQDLPDEERKMYERMMLAGRFR